MSARQFNYFDDYKTEMLACPNCGWRGTFDQGSVETYEDLMDCACPKCDVFQAPILAEVLYPTLEELRANSDRPGIREWVQMIDRGFDEFEAQKLREPKQLPEIDEDSFTLVWDFVADKTYEDDRTVLKHGDVVIFSEPARYQEYRRFGEIAEILKARYGERIKDLVPTERSARYLYGDPRKGEAFVEWVRVHAFGASIVKPEPEDDYHKQRVIESIRALAPDDDLAVPEAEPTFQLSFTKPDEQQSGSVVTAKARGPMRPVPGVPGVAWERTENGTSLVMNPDPEFDNLPDEVRSEIIRRLMKCCAAPQHYLRVTAMRDEFATDPAKATEAARQSDERPSAETDFQYGPELPDIDAVEFSFVFDYSDDDSRYFVLYGKKVILSGPAANDPTDYITDDSLGGQFIEIAKKLKKRYGARLVDLVPTARASNSLMDNWGWALKRDRGRKLVQERQGTPEMTETNKTAPAASAEHKPVDSVGGYKKGDVVTLKGGKKVKITQMYADGKFDHEAAR